MVSEPGAGHLFSRLKNAFKTEKKVDPSTHLKKELAGLFQKEQLSQQEYLMLDSLIDFQDKTAHEVMVPRIDAFMVDETVPFQDNLDEILRQPYSRVPVYRQDKDKIVGVIHIRTVLRKARSLGFDKLDYQEVMYEPLFAPETISLGELLIEMQRTQRQLAILLDEYGGVVGLATIEDLIEEIVGDIDDEVDQAHPLFNKLDNGDFMLDGRMPLEDFNDEFQQHLAAPDVDTVAGYVITELGMIPAKGEKLVVKVPGGHLVTDRMRGSRLLSVRYRILNEEEKKTEDKDKQ